MELEVFNTRYPPAPPKREPLNKDELRKLSSEDGVRLLSKAPSVEVQVRRVPERSGDSGCHLWVFDRDSIPYVLERASAALSLESGVAKHTNLTGGAAASCGGEMWIDPVHGNELYINGCSGRYGPQTPQQLIDAEEVFEQLGFKIHSFGWDEDVDLPARVLR